MHPGKSAYLIFYNGNVFGVSGRSCEIVLSVFKKGLWRTISHLEVKQLSYPPRNGK